MANHDDDDEQQRITELLDDDQQQSAETVGVDDDHQPRQKAAFKLFGVTIDRNHPPPPRPKSIRLLGFDVVVDVDPNSKSRKRKAACEEKSAASCSQEFVMQENLPKLLIEKTLQASDVQKNLNRLLITGSERLEAALTEEERRMLESNSGVFEVITTDPRGVDFKMRLKSWPSMGVKVLNHKWFKLVDANGIQEGDTVQGWGFRAGAAQHLHLAFTVKPKGGSG